MGQTSVGIQAVTFRHRGDSGPRVASLRSFFRVRQGLAALLIAAAVLVRVCVPAGYMPASANGTTVLTICTGAGPVAMSVPVERLGDQHGDTAGKQCSYADLALPALAGADPMLLLMALAFVLAIRLSRLHTIALRRSQALRPPLRGPPLSV